MVGSFSIPAFAAADPALIDTTRTGSISLYKYDVTGAEKDGVWDSSYVSTGIRDESGVEAILGNPARVSALNANGDAYGYAVRGVEFTYVKLADILAYTKTEDNTNRVELLYGIENSELNAAFLNVLGVTANDRFAPADNTEGGKTIYYYTSDVLIDGLKNALNTNGTATRNAAERFVQFARQRHARNGRLRTQRRVRPAPRPVPCGRNPCPRNGHGNHRAFPDLPAHDQCCKRQRMDL